MRAEVPQEVAKSSEHPSGATYAVPGLSSMSELESLIDSTLMQLGFGPECDKAVNLLGTQVKQQESELGD